MQLNEIKEIKKVLQELEQYKFPFVKEKMKKINFLLKPHLDGLEDSLKEEKQAKKEQKTEDKNAKYEYFYFNPINEVKRAELVFSNAKDKSRQAYDEVRVHDRTTQDILHYIELGEVSEEDLLTSAKALKEIREKRRLCKDVVDLTEPINQLQEKYPDLLKDIRKATSEIDRLANSKNNRSYQHREKRAFELAFEQAKEK